MGKNLHIPSFLVHVKFNLLFQGAFWALMVGLVIGIIRMVMDFAYPAPLCMNEDLRPALVSQVQ